MKQTYILHNSFNDIVGYERTAQWAKIFIKNNPDHYFIMIRGDRFGEGFHKYKMTYSRLNKTFNTKKL